MSEGVAALRQRLNPTDQTLFDQLMERRMQLAALLVKGPGQAAPEAYQVQVDKLKAEAEALEARISARSAEFCATAQTVSLEQVQRAIPEGAALVELAVYHSFDPKAPPGKDFGAQRYAAYVLHPHGEPGWVDLGEAAPINRAIEAFRVAIDTKIQALEKGARAPVGDALPQAARALDEQLLRPLRPLLVSVRQVLLAPDGALNLLPFGALVDEAGKYLIERYSLSYLTSGRDLLRLQVNAPPRSGEVILAAPDFGPKGAASRRAEALGRASQRRSRDFSSVYFDALPGTAQEARALKALLPKSRLLTGTQATEAALKQLQGPRLLHIATHGFFLTDEPQPLATPGETPRAATGPGLEHPLLRSGLALAGANRLASQSEDGVLTALEAAGLNLSGTRLVALSACDTGLGTVQNGEGVYGLRRALVLAGAQGQIMTLWQVEDEATRDLMVEFYRRLQAGEGRAEVLRQTQLKFLAQPALNHPYFWASFILSGAWKPLGE